MSDDQKMLQTSRVGLGEALINLVMCLGGI